jgi:hypothetical protein
MHGRGKYVFADGGTYEGEWSGGEMHGRGKYIYDDGETYEGDWIEGEKNGRGKFVYANGDSYEGEYSDDNQHGRGVFTYAVDGKTTLPGLDYSWNAGDRMDCGFKAGVRHGACTYTFFNGETFNCTWADGRCPEFTARQRAVQAAPDHASAQARAQGYASVQAKAAADALVRHSSLSANCMFPQLTLGCVFRLRASATMPKPCSRNGTAVI